MKHNLFHRQTMTYLSSEYGEYVLQAHPRRYSRSQHVMDAGHINLKRRSYHDS
jgi:hypothetical protein